jgi:hypothetical protein
MRDTLFISHATPEDNEFTIWIASRLELMGYKIWIDKDCLLGGERFWKEIDSVIRKDACKILLIYSNHICYENEPGEIKKVINKEIELAESIAENESIKDFIIPLHIDHSRYDLFVGSNMLNHIPFNENWANGFEQLLKKLEKDKIPKKNIEEESTISKWFENEYINKNNIIDKSELYYSTWWTFEDMPNEFFIYVFENKAQADAIYKENTFPIGKISNVLTTFESKLITEVLREDELLNIHPKEKHVISISDLLFGYEKEKFPTHRDSENHFKKLLNQCFFQLMKQHHLYWYELSNRKFAYYYVPNTLPKNKIAFIYPFRGKNKQKKTKSLYGEIQILRELALCSFLQTFLIPFYWI